MSRPRVMLAGVTGYGARHLETISRLHHEGRVELVALVDPKFDNGQELGSADTGSVLRVVRLDDALDQVEPDIVVVASPPHTHLDLSRAVLHHRAALYLEKPPVPLVQELDELIARSDGRRFEVGFQLTRLNLEALLGVWRQREIGEVQRVTACGALTRPDGYYTRARWAGRWFLDGAAVLDGPLFNPLAHVLHTGLSFLRAAHPCWQAMRVEAECYSVREIEGDDLTSLRVSPQEGPVLVAAGTTAGDDVVEPSVTVHGTRGKVTVRHRDGALAVRGRRGILNRAGRTAPRTALESAVTEPSGESDEFLTPEVVRPFVVVSNAAVEAVGAPRRLHQLSRHRVSGPGRQTYLPGAAEAIRAVERDGRLFSELGLPWATAPAERVLDGYGWFSHPALAG